jgi:hypothetical protein
MHRFVIEFDTAPDQSDEATAVVEPRYCTVADPPIHAVRPADAIFLEHRNTGAMGVGVGD